MPRSFPRRNPKRTPRAVARLPRVDAAVDGRALAPRARSVVVRVARAVRRAVDRFDPARATRCRRRSPARPSIARSRWFFFFSPREWKDDAAVAASRAPPADATAPRAPRRARFTGKTDYYARKRLTCQDQNKYNSPKYRLSVRFTNRDVICQVIYATLAGDVTVCAAYSHELPKYGMKAGLTNYAAAYATGLLCARRLLTKYDLAETYEGNEENLGEDYNVEAVDGERRPFKCFLDTGLVRTSTGARVFAALKGAVDGGLDIPHNDKRYAGYDLQDKSLDTDTLERYIKGGVVAEYAEEMQEEVRRP